MMKTIYISFLFAAMSTAALAQSSLYFPAAPGAKWYFKTTPTDTLNNPIDSLSTFSIDSFAVSTTYQGLDAKVVLSKTGLEQSVPLQPYIDTSYINLSGNDGKTYFGASAFLSLLGGIDTTGIDSIFGNISDLINRLASFEGWYTPYRFNNNVNSNYTYFSYDTTVTIDSITLPLRFELRGRRLSDVTLETQIGTFQTKRFVNSFILSYLVGIPPFIVPIGMLTVRDTVWFAPDKWIVQSHIPASGIDLSILGLPSFMLPGSKTVSIPEIIVTSANELLSDIPDEFGILQNYPNPFNPSTTVEYSVNTAGVYTLSLYNTLGEKIQDILSEYVTAGRYRKTINMGSLPAGIYFLRLSGNNSVSTIKLSLLK